MLRFFDKNTLIVLLSFLFLSCNAQVKDKAYSVMLYTLLSHSVNEMSVQEFAAQKDSFQIIDTRSLEEYRVSHIKGAKWVGYESFSSQKVSDLDTTQPVLIYCAVGYRSEKVAEKLQKMGFSDVYNLYGGIFEWANNGMPVYNQNQLTDSIHAYDKKWGFWLNNDYHKVY